MCPSDRIHLPFRWEFVPVENPADRSVEWRWNAYSQSGNLVMSSPITFPTLTECAEDAKRWGYGKERG